MQQLTHQWLVRPIESLGSYFIFFARALKGMTSGSLSPALVFRQMEFVGTRSLGVVLLAAVAVGAVFGLQFGNIFRMFGAQGMIGAAAAYGLSKELAPVVTAFLVTGRGGSAMAAEIATMRVNDQVDALRVMGVNPFTYLIAPRILASGLVMPMLSALFLLVGVICSYFVAVFFFKVDEASFMTKIVDIIEPRFILEGLQKALVFGLIFSSLGCFRGYYARGGAEGVGVAVTSSVVMSLVAILITDFCLSFLQLQIAAAL